MQVGKKARKGANKPGKMAAQKMAQGNAAQVVPVPAYLYAQDRGDLYSPDPGIREYAWQATHGDVLTKSATPAGVGRDEVAFWESVARTDPDPGVREFFWSAIFKATGAA